MTYYFSVESRKGGIGKTTVALNLGRCLLNTGYKVLLLDCDIIGTSIAQCCENSVFWEECINVGGDDVYVIPNYQRPYSWGRMFVTNYIVTSQMLT